MGARPEDNCWRDGILRQAHGDLLGYKGASLPCPHGTSEVANKEIGDKELARAWKEHNRDCQLMYKKIDIMASKMGIHFYRPPALGSGDLVLPLRVRLVW
jgi:hypothetical protein